MAKSLKSQHVSTTRSLSGLKKTKQDPGNNKMGEINKQYLNNENKQDESLQQHPHANMEKIYNHILTTIGSEGNLSRNILYPRQDQDT